MKRSLIVALMLTLSAFSAERASAQTVSAQGSGTVGGSSDCFTCVPPVISFGGKGVSFSFSFSGSCPLMGCGSAVTVMGTFNAVDRETNISLAYSGPGVISPQNHTLCVPGVEDRKSTRLNSSHTVISYAVFCLKKKKKIISAILYREK